MLENKFVHPQPAQPFCPQSISAAIWPSLLRTDISKRVQRANQFARQRNQVINVPLPACRKSKSAFGAKPPHVADSADSRGRVYGQHVAYPQAWMMPTHGRGAPGARPRPASTPLAVSPGRRLREAAHEIEAVEDERRRSGAVVAGRLRDQILQVCSLAASISPRAWIITAESWYGRLERVAHRVIR